MESVIVTSIRAIVECYETHDSKNISSSEIIDRWLWLFIGNSTEYIREHLDGKIY